MTNISLLDEALLRAAASGKSGDEIARETGVPAAQAVVHVKGLLSRRDVWSEVEQRQLLLHQLHELKDSLSEAAISLKDPDSARLLLKTLEIIGKRLDSQQTNLDVQVLRLTEFQQTVLLRAMDSALSFAKKELRERYPDVEPLELDSIVAQGLVLAKEELQQND